MHSYRMEQHTYQILLALCAAFPLPLYNQQSTLYYAKKALLQFNQQHASLQPLLIDAIFLCSSRFWVLPSGGYCYFRAYHPFFLPR